MIDNTVAIVIYALLAVLTIAIIVLTLRKKKRGSLDRCLIFVAASLLGWQIAQICLFASTDPELSRYFFDIKLPFVSLVALSWFLYIIRFYGVDKILPPAAIIALLVIPFFTFVLALTTPFHNYIRSELFFYETVPAHAYYMERGPWFWFNSAYCYFLIAAAFILAIRQHFRTPKQYRRPSNLLVAGLLVSVAGNIAVLAFDIDLDLSLIAATLSAVILYQATRNYQGLAFLLQARNEAFHHIEKAIFMLDSDGGIVNANKAATAWLQEMGIDPKTELFSNVVDQMAARSASKEELDDEEAGTDYRFADGTVFNIRTKPILDNNKEPIGYFAFISNETNNRELIDYLDKHSGLDALTGLYNRRYTEEKLAAFDNAESLPLAILFGDLDNLKQTNDHYGHQQGDILLRLAAETLRTICPPQAIIGRIGGDEFLVAIAHYDEAQVLLLKAEIADYLSRQAERTPFKPSIALGHAIRTSAEEPLETIIQRADQAMYTEKQKNKARR